MNSASNVARLILHLFLVDFFFVFFWVCRSLPRNYSFSLKNFFYAFYLMYFRHTVKTHSLSCKFPKLHRACYVIREVPLLLLAYRITKTLSHTFLQTQSLETGAKLFCYFHLLVCCSGILHTHRTPASVSSCQSSVRVGSLQSYLLSFQKVCHQREATLEQS